MSDTSAGGGEQPRPTPPTHGAGIERATERTGRIEPVADRERADGDAPAEHTDGPEGGRSPDQAGGPERTGNGKPPISTLGLTREYAPGVGAIDVDLAVPAGSIYGFLGPNGAGKSTTIRMLTGMTPPDRGTASVLGLDPTRDAVELKRRIGVVSGDQQIPRHHSGRSLLQLVARLRGDDGIVDRGVSLAGRFDLQLDRPGHELSLGNRQKVAIVTAFAHDPELAILDEPSNGLDPLLQRELDELLREFTSSGRTVLLSSHSLAEVERVADHVGFIRGARLVEQTSMEEMTSRAVRRATFRFPEPLAEGDVETALAVEPVREVVLADAGRTATLTYQGAVGPMLRWAGVRNAVSIEARGADLEATFLALYRTDAEGDQ